MSTLLEDLFGEEYTMRINKASNEGFIEGFVAGSIAVLKEEKKTLKDLVKYIQENCPNDDLLAQIEDKIKHIVKKRKFYNFTRNVIENL